MSIGSGGRFLVWPVRDAVCENKLPGRAARKLVRRHNKRTRPVRVGEHRFEDCSPSSLRAARRRGRGRRGARPAQLLGASCWARAAGRDACDTSTRRNASSTEVRAQTPSPIQSRRQSRGHEQERTRRRRRAASPRSAPAPARSSASAESARSDKKTSNSALDAPAGCRSTSWQRFSSPQDVRRSSGW